MKITIHTSEDFKKMKEAGKLAAKVLDHISKFVTPGVTTNYLNEVCHNMIIENGGIPAPLNYRGFPKSICTSINEVVCHGIPSERKLIDGDLINVDITVILDGWHGDVSKTFIVGNRIDNEKKRLVEITYNAMMKAIELVKPGLPLNEIGRTIQKYAEKQGYSVVRDYCGHGIGRTFHADPQVLHYYHKNINVILREGMFFTIEPMINAGKHETKTLNDDWTVVTQDGSLSAQFEHTIGVTKSGYIIFTDNDLHHKEA